MWVSRIRLLPVSGCERAPLAIHAPLRKSSATRKAVPRLLGIQSRIAMGMVTIRQILGRDRPRAPVHSVTFLPVIST